MRRAHALQRDRRVPDPQDYPDQSQSWWPTSTISRRPIVASRASLRCPGFPERPQRGRRTRRRVHRLGHAASRRQAYATTAALCGALLLLAVEAGAWAPLGISGVLFGAAYFAATACLGMWSLRLFPIAPRRASARRTS